MENFALSAALNDAQKERLKAMLMNALVETTGEAEEMIVEYVMVMVENGRTMSSMSAELSTFISAEHATEIIKRLYQHLTADTQQQQPEKAPPKAAATTTTPAKEKAAAKEVQAKETEKVETTAAKSAPQQEEKQTTAATTPKAWPQSKVISLRGSSSAAAKEALERPLSSRREGPASTAKAVQPASKASEQQREREAKSQSSRLLASAMQESLRSTRDTGRKSAAEQRTRQTQQDNTRETRGARQTAAGGATGNKRNPQQQRDVGVGGDGARANKRRKDGGHTQGDNYEIELSDSEVQGHPAHYMPPPGMAGASMPMGMMDPSMYFQQMEEYAQMMGFSSAEEYMEAYQQQMMSMMGGGMPPFGHAPRGRGFRGGRAPRGRGGRGRGPSRAPGPTTAPGRNMTWVRESDMESALSSRR